MTDIAETAPESLTAKDPARDTANRSSKKNVAIGAAVGIGSAAIVAALLYTRRK